MAKTTWEQATGTVVSVDSIYPRGRRQLIVTFTYEAEGQSYAGELYTFESFHEGDSLIVKYDALNPKQNQFEAKQNHINLVALVVPFIIFAGFFLVWFSLRRQ